MKGDPADPAAYASSDSDLRGLLFRDYATVIDGYPAASFDLVMVDGRARPSCAAHGVSRVKPGGYLLLDNAERPHYRWIHQHMDSLGWRRFDLSGPGPYLRQFWGGTAWRKPVTA